MGNKKFTNISLAKIKPDPSRRIEISEPSGLRVIVQPNGFKSWGMRYRFNGQSRKLTFGTVDHLELAEARKLAAKSWALLANGIDPAAAKKQPANGATTFATVALDFIERQAKPNMKSAKQLEALLRRHALPVLGGKDITAITKQDIVGLLDGISDEAPISANRTLAAVRRVLNWAVSRGTISASPALGVKAPTKEVSRDRVLTDSELRSFVRACKALPYPVSQFGMLLLLTGQRRSEVAGMRWSELDGGRVWTIPAERSKNGRANTLPLPEAVIEILESIAKSNSDYVLTVAGHGPTNNFARMKVAIDALMPKGENWTFHDLRRTCASGLAKLGVPPHICEELLNHKTGTISAIGKIYNRYSYETEKREALELWSQHVVGLNA